MDSEDHARTSANRTGIRENWRQGPSSHPSRNQVYFRGCNSSIGKPNFERGGLKAHSRHQNDKFDLNRLESILLMSSHEALITLLNNHEDLSSFLMETNMSSDLKTIMFELLAHVSNTPMLTNLAHLLKAFVDASFFGSINTFILNLPLDDNRKGSRLWNDCNKFFINVAVTLQALLDIPTKETDLVQQILKTAQYSMANIQTSFGINISIDTEVAYRNVQAKIDKILKQANRKKFFQMQMIDEGNPPDDFRSIDIYPSVDEITTDVDTFLRKNIICGGYRDVDHYLDVQFRLLREDFVRPLRAGIREYMELAKNDVNKKLTNIIVFKNVSCVGFTPTNHGAGYVMQVFKQRIAVVRENSKRFMFGSLVCLTPDNFKTILFGKVVDGTQIPAGRVILTFDQKKPLMGVKYILIECNIYFEPYYNVLNALQQIVYLPMKKYFVDVETENRVPSYLSDEYNIDEVVDLKKSILNDSQLQAFKGALTKEFCIIQGPPGTGKTFLGLQIAKQLLGPYRSSPMLVLCQTNHALDQFLEGLLDYTQNLVRVGGQSKNENLKMHNSNVIRSFMSRDEGKAYFTLKERIKNDLDLLTINADQLSKIFAFECLIEFSTLNAKEVNPYYKNSWFSKVNKNEHLKWLLYQDGNNMQVHFEEELVFSDLNSSKICELEKDIQSMCKESLQHTDYYVTVSKRLHEIKAVYNYVSDQLIKLKQLNEIPIVAVDYNKPNTMPPGDRWLLYAGWVRAYYHKEMEIYLQSNERYKRLIAQYQEMKDMLDVRKMEDAEVIGMTTTCAARLHNTLQQLKCPIVIVEEAAEVLEAHIVTALSPYCKHLILIGDHKQLKPATADYTLERHYHLGVSLFERMVENDLQCHTLTVQHRMHPQIANLVSPSIYSALENHPSVSTYPSVLGINKPLYFISHDNPEASAADSSKANPFEAEYLIKLANYLVLNNNDPSKITIIVAYVGQWVLMKRLKANHPELIRVRVCVLDNFQGEENDIILLSLVRSNPEGKIGFLSLENRVCVALSRARHGLYIMGNMPQLCQASSIWKEVAEVLEKYNALGTQLSVACVNHPNTVTHLKAIMDFEQVPEGGCLEKCATLLDCGHICKMLCHGIPHDRLPCRELCEAVICDYGHLCPLLCYDKCRPCIILKPATLPCGHDSDIPCYQLPEEAKCRILVPTTLPCKHEVDKPCSADSKQFQCPMRCDALLSSCNHRCSALCHSTKQSKHSKCFRPCEKYNNNCRMDKENKHRCKKSCFYNCDNCSVFIEKQLDCGHTFVGQCSNSSERCTKMVEKKIEECGHQIMFQCSYDPNKKNCKSPNCVTVLPCGHQCTLPCASKCTDCKCMELVPLTNPSPCGHNAFNVPCHLAATSPVTNEIMSYCTTECNTQLKCGHTCTGTCGECAQGRIHTRCDQLCQKVLFCGHEHKIECGDDYKICDKICPRYCEHSKCTHQCGEECNPCEEACTRVCEHQACTVLCSRVCTVSPCHKPCSKVLSCSHPCIGFCGDICPPLCWICNEIQLSELITSLALPSTSHTAETRFIYLPSCQHIFESKNLDDLLFGEEKFAENSKITFLTCPKCRTPIEIARYKEHNNDAFRIPYELKKKYSWTATDIDHVLEELDSIKKTSWESTSTSIFFSYMFYTLAEVQKEPNDKFAVSKLDSLKSRFVIFKRLLKCLLLKKIFPLAAKSMEKLRKDYYEFLLTKLCLNNELFSQLQIEDLLMESLRVYRMRFFVNFASKIKTTKQFSDYDSYGILFSCKRYDMEQDTIVHNEMQGFSAKLPNASSFFKHMSCIKQCRQVCFRCSTCGCIYFKNEFFGYFGKTECSGCDKSKLK